ERDDAREGEQVGGHHPLNRSDRRVEIATESGNGDVDNGRIENSQDHPKDDDASGHEDLGREQALRALMLSRGGWKLLSHGSPPYRCGVYKIRLALKLSPPQEVATLTP